MKLKKRLGIEYIMIALLPFVAGMLFIMLRTSTTIKEDAIGFLTEYSGRYAGQIGDFFSDKRGYIEAYSHMTDVQTFNWKEVAPIFGKIAKENTTVDSFFLAQKDGTFFRSDLDGNPALGGLVTIDDTDPNAEPRSIADRDYFMRLISNNPEHKKMTVVSAPLISKATGKKQIILCSDILDDTKNLYGLIGVTITGMTFEEKLEQISANIQDAFGTAATVVILTDTGELVSFRSFNKWEHKYVEQALSSYSEDLADLLPEELEPVFAKLSTSDDPYTTYFDRQNLKLQYVACNNIPGTNYYVLLSLPASVLFRAIGSIQTSLWIISIITVVIVLLLAGLLGGRIAKPLAGTANTLKDIAEGSGDLTYRIKMHGNDEISDMARHINRFIETLHDMISQIKTDADTIDAISGDLQQRSGDIQKGIETISSNVTDLNFQTEEQSASVTETSSTIHQIAKNIESLTQQIETQSASVTESSAAIQQMVSNVNSISTNLDRAGGSFEYLLTASNSGRDSMQNVIELVKDVSNQSEHLLETNEIIDSIANQTNLLAMNAAIEAAHAGEAGKGFSVVSDEIRKLAENSAEQSKVIEEELKKVVNTIATIVDASATADDAFGAVAKQIKEANGLIQEIRMAMKEQNEGSRQVLEALEEIQDITTQIRDGSLEMNQGTSMILKEMTRLEDISHKVQESTQDIARSSEDIGRTIEEIHSVTTKNATAVDSLNEITGRFKL